MGGNITYYSELASKVSSQLLHYLFLFILNNITSKSLTIDSEVITPKAKKISFVNNETEVQSSANENVNETLEEVSAAAEETSNKSNNNAESEPRMI